jgi:prepilin-type N-terminal cleavage/methylation domain-containing protein
MKLRSQWWVKSERGFTAVEILVGIVLFGILLAGLTSAYTSIKSSYTTARQLSEMYTVLSACPEVDRALEYTSLSGATNCYPNNVFQVENTTDTHSISYSPSLTVTDTSSLSASDPLQTVPDSKVVNITLAFPAPTNASPLQLRMLITRNGIGQQ